ncbi:arginase family protein [Fulvivirgaceae bacterium PWU4]|uniref:Arginase family protein n=1 Tax=Chryseosolibacter histidini TaxID=2782349 RepID=A0AAP2GK65_9BACT|nr:arginase family protein [Chryseosolibacter histidini]MBT1698724.1 arginase family protein [Chryseosolibacter histidini]
MDRQIVSAPSILGLRPSGVERLAESLLSNGLKEKMGATNPVLEIATLNHTYSRERNANLMLNEDQLAAFSDTMYGEIGKLFDARRFPLVLGGDCSIIIGIMAALKSKGTHGLIFMDAHADFYLPHQSTTGEAADMDLAIVTGRGTDKLTNLHNLRPYVKDAHVFQVGQRDASEARHYGAQSTQDTEINCFDYELFKRDNLDDITGRIISKASSHGVDGYWIHFDADVLSDDVNPAVDYQLPGGLSFEQCEYLLRSFLRSLAIVGMSVTIFNPQLDTTGNIAKRLVSTLSEL